MTGVVGGAVTIVASGVVVVVGSEGVVDSAGGVVGVRVEDGVAYVVGWVMLV